MPFTVEHRKLPQREPRIRTSRIFDQMIEREVEGGGVTPRQWTPAVARQILKDHDLLVVPMKEKSLEGWQKITLEGIAIQLGVMEESKT